ncbi:WD40-repeat-containing domain protein [Neocallimastix sp. 'constans']|jgi:WD40 repeat protein
MNNKIDNIIKSNLNKILTQSDNKKIEIIYEIASSLSKYSLQKLSKKLEPLFHFDILYKLPNEIAIKILSYTNCNCISSISRVSKYWYQLSNDNSLWKQFYSYRWGSLDFVERRLYQYYSYFHEAIIELELENRNNLQFNEILCLLENIRIKEYTGKTKYNYNKNIKLKSIQKKKCKNYKDIETIVGIWKAIYYLHVKLDSNWNNKNYCICSMLGHTDSIYCLQYDNNKIISGSRDKTIKIWDLKTNECIKTLEGHNGSVLTLQFNEKYLVSGSSDNTIILWDIKTYKIIKRITDHEDSVLNVKLNENYIVSSSKDHSIRIWDIHTGNFIRKLEENNGANAIQLKDNIIVSASNDHAIRIWSLSTGKLLKTLIGHKHAISCIFFDGNIIISGSSDCTLKIWNLHTSELLYTLYGHTELVRTIQFNSKKIISGSYDRTIKIWDFNTRQLLFSLDGHLSKIFCLQFSDSKIISCSSDNRIIKWDFSRDILNLFP